MVAFRFGSHVQKKSRGNRSSKMKTMIVVFAARKAPSNSMAQMPAPATVLLTALGSSEDGGGQQGPRQRGCRKVSFAGVTSIEPKGLECLIGLY